MQLTVMGCGDAFGAGGRFHSCYLLDTSAGRIMIDCGSSAPVALKKANFDTNSIDAIIITHGHGDHMGGLPYLYLEHLFLHHSTKTFDIFAPEGFEQRFETLMECLLPKIQTLPRPFRYHFHKLKPDVEITWRGLELQVHEVSHFAGDDMASFGVSISNDEKRFAYSGDSGWCEALVSLGRNADLYLIECSNYSHKLEMHLDYLTLRKHFGKIGAKRYLLTHMGDEMLASLHKIDGEHCITAEDGLVIKI